MIFSYNWLQDYIKEKLPKPKKLAELLTMHSFEVADLKKVGKDWMLDIEVLTNRGPDCFSHLGVAREIAAIANLTFQMPNFKIVEDKKLKTKDFISVLVKEKIACPRYTARVVINVKVDSSPKWIKTRLKACGLRPINNIVDIANFVMLETGQPLHAFDGEKLENQKIIVRFVKNKEKIITLDNEKYVLDKEILVIADNKKPVAIAGIKGGKIPEVTKKTKIVVLESANFKPRTIRRGSKKINLETDASWRFEHGIDPNLTELAINRAVFLIQKIAGGKIPSGLIDFYPKKVLPRRIKLDLNYVKSLLGIKISKREIKNIIKRLGFQITGVRPLQLEIEIPTRRLDISLPEDLIEEIGRIYGFEKIKAIFPQTSLIPPKRNLEIFWQNKIRKILEGAGFTETYNYSFISQQDVEIFDFFKHEVIEVENPISRFYQFLRPTLIINLLKNVKTNLRYFDEIKLFEIGKIFKKSYEPSTTSKLRKSGPVKIIEKRQFSGLIFKKDGKKDIFFELKGVIDYLLEKLGISGLWYDSYQPTPEDTKRFLWHPKKVAEIKIDHQEIGFLGEIAPKILEKLKLKQVVVFDFDLEQLTKYASGEHEFLPISKYPAAVRDIAILVPIDIKVVDVLNKINAAGGPLVKDVDLFDMYEGAELPAGMKNLAFHIIYQAQDRTLSSKEIDKIQKRIIKALEEEPEWQVRK